MYWVLQMKELVLPLPFFPQERTSVQLRKEIQRETVKLSGSGIARPCHPSWAGGREGNPIHKVGSQEVACRGTRLLVL